MEEQNVSIYFLKCIVGGLNVFMDFVYLLVASKLPPRPTYSHSYTVIFSAYIPPLLPTVKNVDHYFALDHPLSK